jgi:hypothetical protein
VSVRNSWQRKEKSNPVAAGLQAEKENCSPTERAAGSGRGTGAGGYLGPLADRGQKNAGLGSQWAFAPGRPSAEIKKRKIINTTKILSNFLFKKTGIM